MSAFSMPFQLSAQLCRASALSVSQMTTPLPRAGSCHLPICFIRLPLSVASCSAVILENTAYPSWIFPVWNCHVIMNVINRVHSFSANDNMTVKPEVLPRDAHRLRHDIISDIPVFMRYRRSSAVVRRSWELYRA